MKDMIYMYFNLTSCDRFIYFYNMSVMMRDCYENILYAGSMV